MTKRYEPKVIEPKWQKKWEDDQLYKADLNSKKPKYLAMSMFNYPSGAGIHIGHAMNYTISDVKARFKRQSGYESYHPVGWDAFGLPAENYAIKAGVSPQASMAKIIPSYHEQYKAMGWSNDWSKEIATHMPDYYKWTQWIFVQMYKNGLAYQDSRMQWWCEQCQTVLANEQIVDGKCWRHDGPDDPLVVQKEVKQWFFKITEYADELLDAIDDLDWTDSVKTAQKNWIGRSQGAEIKFDVDTKIVDHFVLLHGKGGSSDRNFLSWLKKQLENRGYSVDVPDMPNTDEPNDDGQTEYVLENCRIDERTAIIGHSFGGIVAMRLLERNVKLAKLFLVATPHSGTFLDGKTRPTVENAIKKGFNFEVIKNNCSDIKAIYDSSDNIVPVSDGEQFSSELSCQLLINKAKEPHFVSDEEPFILESLIQQGQTSIKVFTTRPDTIFGATFLVLAPEHELVDKITKDQQRSEVDDYIKVTQKKSELDRQTAKEKTGVFTGSYAVNPASGEKIPIWIADYVLTGYGTGAIMAVPAHDERDHEFAVENKLKISKVIEGSPREYDTPEDFDDISNKAVLKRLGKSLFTGEGVMVNSGEYNDMDSSEARDKIVADLAKKGLAEEKVNYKMRDWSVSRQRYWGAPIPVIYCDKDGVVIDENLPVILPELQDFKPSGDGRSALARATDWLNVDCPKCGGKAQRETDTLDTYICSSWYFLRYLDPENNKEIFGTELANKWMPVDFYNGGDHATAHMLYARFVTRFFTKLGLLNNPEPFKQFLFNGKVRASDGTAFSKSKGNGVDPLEIITQGYGADALRTYLMFAAPLEFNANWDPQGVPGTYRFLNRLYTLVQEYLETDEIKLSQKQAQEIRHATHSMIKKTSEDIEENRYNTAISALMKCVNDLYKLKTVEFGKCEEWQEALEAVVACSAPFAPYIAEELWHDLGHDSSVHKDSWPVHNEEYLVGETMTIIVQINGKLRGQINVDIDAKEDQIIELAKQDPKIAEHLKDKQLRKTIYVANKLINFVV